MHELYRADATAEPGADGVVISDAAAKLRADDARADARADGADARADVSADRADARANARADARAVNQPPDHPTDLPPQPRRRGRYGRQGASYRVYNAVATPTSR